MLHSPVAAFDTTVQKTNIWLKELKQLGNFRDEEHAYKALRAVLQTLRDQLTVEEASHLGAQLPLLLRGVFFEGWKPAAVPVKERGREAFLSHVEGHLQPAGSVSPAEAVNACFRLLDNRITSGELEDVKSALPHHVRKLWP